MCYALQMVFVPAVGDEVFATCNVMQSSFSTRNLLHHFVGNAYPCFGKGSVNLQTALPPCNAIYIHSIFILQTKYTSLSGDRMVPNNKELLEQRVHINVKDFIHRYYIRAALFSWGIALSVCFNKFSWFLNRCTWRPYTFCDGISGTNTTTVCFYDLVSRNSHAAYARCVAEGSRRKDRYFWRREGA